MGIFKNLLVLDLVFSESTVFACIAFARDGTTIEMGLTIEYR